MALYSATLLLLDKQRQENEGRAYPQCGALKLLVWEHKQSDEHQLEGNCLTFCLSSPVFCVYLRIDDRQGEIAFTILFLLRYDNKYRC